MASQISAKLQEGTRKVEIPLKTRNRNLIRKNAQLSVPVSTDNLLKNLLKNLLS